ncbi:MAG: Ig-like domain-containing protein [Abditibacteriota bacterium]|nr:Ig-like domain-containing protein [Abditibacteriota bacterium]
MVYSIAPNGNRAVTVVNVIYPEYTIDVDTSSISLYGGKSYQINATLTPNIGKLRWSSSDKKVATVDRNGLVKAKRMIEGEATITITAPDGKTKDTCVVHVATNKRSFYK